LGGALRTLQYLEVLYVGIFRIHVELDTRHGHVEEDAVENLAERSADVGVAVSRWSAERGRGRGIGHSPGSALLNLGDVELKEAVEPLHELLSAKEGCQPSSGSKRAHPRRRGSRSDGKPTVIHPSLRTAPMMSFGAEMQGNRCAMQMGNKSKETAQIEDPRMGGRLFGGDSTGGYFGRGRRHFPHPTLSKAIEIKAVAQSTRPRQVRGFRSAGPCPSSRD